MEDIKTQYNPKIRHSHLSNEFENSDETNFYNQLTNDEKYDYLHLKIIMLEKKQEAMFAEVDLIEFQTDRNHPDEEIYKTHHTGHFNSHTPTNELALDLDEKINHFKSMLKIVNEEDDDEVQKVSQ